MSRSPQPDGPDYAEDATRADDPEDPIQPLKDVVGDSSLFISVVGAVFALVTVYIPASPLVGGVLAGYPVRDGTGRGARVGALSGVWMTVPTAFVLLFVASVTIGFATFGDPRALLGLFSVLIGVLGLFYTVGLATIGGYLGVVLYQRRKANATARTTRGGDFDGRRNEGSSSRDQR